jgi:hypothetical protein
MNDIYRLLIAALCTWRLTHLLQAEDGPWEISVRIRRAAGDGFFGRLLDCFYCLSLWISLPIAWAICEGPLNFALLWPALSGAAILLERATSGPAPVAAVAHEAEFREPGKEG